MNDVIFDDFENFLLNLIVDSINRWLNAYERWKNVKQNLNQKIIVFKIYLKNLKSYLFLFEEIHKTFFFSLNFVMNLNKKFLISKTFRILEKIFWKLSLCKKRIWNVNATITTITKIRILIKIENLKISKTTNFKTIKINNNYLIKSINLSKNRSRKRLLNVFENLTIIKLFCSKSNAIIIIKKAL